jgi:hypothetical protein
VFGVVGKASVSWADNTLSDMSTATDTAHHKDASQRKSLESQWRLHECVGHHQQHKQCLEALGGLSTFERTCAEERRGRDGTCTALYDQDYGPCMQVEFCPLLAGSRLPVWAA